MSTKHIESKHHHEHLEYHRDFKPALTPADQKELVMTGVANETIRRREEEQWREKVKLHAGQQRRKFLDMVAKTGISTAMLRNSSLVLGALSSRYALAAGGFAGKRVVVISLTQGCPGDQWLPNGPNDTREVSHPYKDRGVSGLTAFRHVNVINGGHSSQYQALGSTDRFGFKPTFDMNIAAVMGVTTPYSNMHLGANALTSVRNGAPQFLFSISNDGQAVDGPKATLDRFFNSAPAPKEDKGAQMLIDLQRKNVEALKSKLGVDEQIRMQAHLDAISKLQEKLVPKDAMPFNLAACNKSGPTFNGDTLAQGRDQAKLIASAFACGLTNIAVLQVGDNQVPFHGHAHSGNFGAFVGECRAQQEVPAEMLKLLVDTKDANGQPLINSTVLLVTNDMGNGNDHGPGNSPWAMATKLPEFKTGFSAGGGGNCRDFFTAVAQGLGLPDGTYTDQKGNASAANILA